jgi:outer membrane receptor protein involved in Fe transport
VGYSRGLTQSVGQNWLSGAIVACLFACAPQVSAQTSSATLRGQVTREADPTANARVTATNIETGFARTAQSGEGGNYALGGLPPGTYRVQVEADGQTSTRVVVLQVGQTATLDLDMAPQEEQIEGITVSATQLYESRTSEVATYVSTRQIEALPQSSRNFLAFADTVPGVQFVTSADGSTSELRSGAQASNGVNVFIDGVGQKNYVLRGGVSGQTSSRGNPFPQLGIDEYKVITSNYKAEFDQLSSAAIVAVTRSGTNEFEAAAFWDRTSENWRASDPLERRAGEKVKSEQEQYGMAIGGPLIQDRMHFFVTYEAKKFETPETITLGQGLPTAGEFDRFLGPTSSPFDEDLFFGKIDLTVGDSHLFELTAKYRDESEITAIGGQDTDSFATSQDNSDTRLDLRYQFSSDRFLNDAHITYEEAEFNPRPVSLEPGYVLTTGNPDQTILNLGGGRNFQDKGQKGWSFQNDLTLSEFEWYGAHAVKTGLKYKQIEINAFQQQPYNPQFYYDINNDLTIPYRVQFGAPLPGFPDRNVLSENDQLGIYLQDDWEVTDKLLLNLGVRWDYEETPSYLDYVTPADVVAGLNAPDPDVPGQTHAQRLALGGVDVNDYISTGNNRDAFTDAIQPRLGFSYDLFADQRHVIFGGAGRAYDRNVFDYLALEQSQGTFPSYIRTFNAPGHPCTPGVGDCLAWDPALLDRAALEALVAANPQLGREVYLINNDLKTPYSDQVSLGMRNQVRLWDHDWNTSAAVSYIESNDGIVFLLGNRYPDGSFRPAGTTWGNQPWAEGIPGLGNLILGKNGLKTRATALLLQAEKPYSRESAWSATVAYTFTDAKENRTRIAAEDEHSIFDYPEVSGFGWHTSTGVPKHRLVTTAIADVPWGLTVSAKLTLSTPLEHEAVNCFNAPDFNNCSFQNFKPDTTFGYKQFDLALQKSLSGLAEDFVVNLRADVLNVFNHENVSGYDTWRGAPNEPNPTLGRANAYYQPTRTFKLSLNVDWR